jgi:type II secretory pathway pseudopilin PulG
LVAVAILGLAIVVFLTGLSTALMAVRAVDERVYMENLARRQLEDTKQQPFSPSLTYPTVSPDVSLAVTNSNPPTDTVQVITATVSYHGKTFQLSEYKVKR